MGSEGIAPLIPNLGTIWSAWRASTLGSLYLRGNPKLCIK